MMQRVTLRGGCTCTGTRGILLQGLWVLVARAGVEKFIEEAGEPATDISSPPPPETSELERILSITQK
jgi:hypothetical protein